MSRKLVVAVLGVFAVPAFGQDTPIADPASLAFEQGRWEDAIAEYRAILAERPIDIETCRRYGGKLRVIASIEEPSVIERILKHLGGDGESLYPAHPSRAPPERDLFAIRFAAGRAGISSAKGKIHAPERRGW